MATNKDPWWKKKSEKHNPKVKKLDPHPNEIAFTEELLKIKNGYRPGDIIQNDENSLIFDGKTLKEMWEKANIISTPDSGNWIGAQPSWAGSSGTWQMNEAPNQLIVLYGFTGKLAWRYSVCTLTKEEINAKIAMTSFSTINPKLVMPPILSVDDFQRMRDGFPGQFIEISFEEALDVIKGATEKPLISNEYEEPEEEEFTDACLVDCKPGDHKCGKK